MYNITETWEDLPFNFSGDFIIASHFGEQAIMDTYNRILEDNENDYRILIRLIYDVNSLSWYFYEQGNETLSRIFARLYDEAVDAFDATYENAENKKEIYNYYFQKLD